MPCEELNPDAVLDRIAGKIHYLPIARQSCSEVYRGLSVLKRRKSKEWAESAAARAATCCTVAFAVAAGSFGGDLNDPTAGGEQATFLLMGRPIDKWQPPLKKDILDKYKQALGSIIDAKSCLISDNLPESLMDWSTITSLEHLNVCIFFVAKQLRSELLVKDWLIRNKFIVSDSKVLVMSVMRKMGIDGDGKEFNATLAYGEFPSSLNAIASIVRPKNLTVTITYNAYSQPLNVNSGFNYK